MRPPRLRPQSSALHFRRIRFGDGICAAVDPMRHGYFGTRGRLNPHASGALTGRSAVEGRLRTKTPAHGCSGRISNDVATFGAGTITRVREGYVPARRGGRRSAADLPRGGYGRGRGRGGASSSRSACTPSTEPLPPNATNDGNLHRWTLEGGDRCNRSAPAPDRRVRWRPRPSASTLRCARLLMCAHAMLKQHMGHPLSPMRIPRLKTCKRVAVKSLVPSLFHDRRGQACVWFVGPPFVRSASGPSRSESVRNRGASAGFLDSLARGTYQACVARGRHELLAAAPTPLLRRSPLELAEEPIALAHAASYRSSGWGVSVAGGEFILNVERGGGALQIRIVDGARQVVGGCVEVRTNGGHWCGPAAISVAGDDSEWRVGV